LQAQTDTSTPRRSVAITIIGAVAAVSSIFMLVLGSSRPEGITMWTFARLHNDIYQPAIEVRNAGIDPNVTCSVLGIQAIEQRMLSSFLSRTPSADLLEVERRIASRAFAGPAEAVGFVDLTDRLKAEGLLERINAPSFTPWSSRGRIYGLPHDVHPVMLGYRADIVEAAGIDVSTIETWDDFIRVLSPLLMNSDGTRRTDRFLLNMWETHMDALEALVLQAGGGAVDERGLPMLDHPANAKVLASAMAWAHGKDRIAADAPYFSASGNQLLLDGFVIASFVPDWMCNLWRKEIPQLAGKVKLMPLPAWEKGGRRTSVWGGTMLGISRDSKNIEQSWEFAKYLYLDQDLARRLFVEGDIISPVREFWNDPVYDAPDPFFSNQPRGRLFVSLAGDLPPRYNSPFGAMAVEKLRSVASELAAYADAHPGTTASDLEPKARELLKSAQTEVMVHAKRNRFFAEAEVVTP
jgi:arabinosaccharide transport system substrate-binding protein